MRTIRLKNTGSNTILDGRVVDETCSSCRVVFKLNNMIYSLEYCKVKKSFVNVEYQHIKILL